MSDGVASQMRHAACHCGKLKLAVTGDPKKVSLCHCLQCQRRTGSLFSVAAFYPRDAVSILEGEAKAFRRSSASGSTVTFHFCGDCGSNLWWESERMPRLVGMAVGSFADPGFPIPDQAVWTEEQHPWLSLPEELPRHARNPRPPTSDPRL